MGRWARREKGPNLRMSFITYSTLGHTLMKLTSDRNEIRDGLSRLQNIVPSGATHMQEGFKKANEQIEGVYSKNSTASSLVITLTTGPLLPTTLRETKSEADKARDMGAKVYCLGVKDYKKDQLHDIVERKDQMYGIDEFKSLEKLVTSLVENSCMEVMAGDTYFVCLGGLPHLQTLHCAYLYLGKLDTFYDFVQHCSQVPLMWCPPRDMGRCVNFALMYPHYAQMLCRPKMCL
ncbi:anthrax toxin receptor 1-like isoform X1 [Balaenoptera musculus]|uniref:Anthrax toxin receptor 1-like isoform X1 n=2 Tax=Balaenoptera musculus TaxID=9771 RepID=A0A8B8VFR2_BALMU|nr:anthrax toxin receptor 1-like isoform X1 [Balaenoptera musculus]